MLSRRARTRWVPVTYLVLLTFGPAQLVPLAEAAEWLRQRNTTYHFAVEKGLARQLLPPEWYAAVNKAYDRYQQRFFQIFHESTAVAQRPSDPVAATQQLITFAHQPPPNQASLVTIPATDHTMTAHVNWMEQPGVGERVTTEEGAGRSAMSSSPERQRHVRSALRRLGQDVEALLNEKRFQQPVILQVIDDRLMGLAERYPQELNEALKQGGFWQQAGFRGTEVGRQFFEHKLPKALAMAEVSHQEGRPSSHRAPPVLPDPGQTREGERLRDQGVGQAQASERPDNTQRWAWLPWLVPFAIFFSLHVSGASAARLPQLAQGRFSSPAAVHTVQQGAQVDRVPRADFEIPAAETLVYQRLLAPVPQALFEAATSQPDQPGYEPVLAAFGSYEAYVADHQKHLPLRQQILGTLEELAAHPDVGPAIRELIERHLRYLIVTDLNAPTFIGFANLQHGFVMLDADDFVNRPRNELTWLIAYYMPHEMLEAVP